MYSVIYRTSWQHVNERDDTSHIATVSAAMTWEHVITQRCHRLRPCSQFDKNIDSSGWRSIAVLMNHPGHKSTRVGGFEGSIVISATFASTERAVFLLASLH